MRDGGISFGGVYSFSELTDCPFSVWQHRSTKAIGRSEESAPSGQRLSRDRIVLLEVTLQIFKVGRVEVIIERRLVRELLIEHELGRILRIEVKLVDEAPGFFTRGNHERVQLSAKLLFMTRGRLEINIEEDRSISHYSRIAVWS